MSHETLSRQFAAMGVRVKFRPRAPEPERPGVPVEDFVIDIRTDSRGEYFDFALSEGAPEFHVLQAQPKERHLLLRSSDGQRFLCGHDERHWFVAPIADRVSSVRGAKQSLLPPAVWERMKRLPAGEVERRRNVVFVRQGEWFFVPTERRFDNPVIHKNEPIQRSPESKPHICEELIREGGTLVYIVDGVQYSQEEYEQRKAEDRFFDRRGFRTMIANPEMHARGYVRHPDHATITLPGWHRVFINAELVMSSVAFLD